MNKPTPLEKILDEHPYRVSEPDSIRAAREELRVLRELCEALTDERNADQAWEIVGRIQNAEKAYREWKAKQEGGR